MTRTLQLRREVLTDLTTDELGAVVGGATRPVRDCVTAVAVTVIATTALVTALSICTHCPTVPCDGAPELG